MRVADSTAASSAALRLLSAATIVGQASAVLRAGATGGTLAGNSYNYGLRGEDWTQGECADRERQSPVDFGKAAPWDCGPNVAAPSIPGCYIGPVHFEYNAIDGNLSLRPGSTALGLEATGKGYGGLTYNGRWFNLLSVNFHAGSEHTFHGQRLSLEMHLVHKEQDDGQILVIAVPFEAAAAMQAMLAPGPAPGPVPKPCPPSPPPTPVPGPKLPEIRERIKQIGFPPGQGGENDAAAVGSALAGTAVVEDMPMDWEETAQWSYSRPGPSPPSLFQQVQRGRLRAGRAAAGRQDPGSSPLLQKLFVESFPAPNGALEVAVGVPTDFFNPLVEGGTFFEYAGSLTVPPCMEEVTWLVRRDPLVASALQASKLHEAVAAANSGTENWRSTMPLLGRRIYVRDAQRGRPPLATPSPEEQQMQQSLQKERQDQNMQGTVNDAYLFKGAKMGTEAMAWAYAADQNYMNIALGLGIDPSNPSMVTRGSTSASPSAPPMAAPSPGPPGAVSSR